MLEGLYKVTLFTNDYRFLFRFAWETDAEYIELDKEVFPGSVNLYYSDQERAAECQAILESIVGG